MSVVRGYRVPLPVGFALLEVTETRAFLQREYVRGAPLELVLIDLETGRELARRVFPLARWSRLAGAFVLLDAPDGLLVVDADLTGEPRLFANDDDSFTVRAAHRGIAVISARKKVMTPDSVHFIHARIGIDLATAREIYRAENDAPRWFPHDGRGALLLGTTGSTIVALRIADGATAWTAEPFAGRPINDVVGAYLDHANGREVHARAGTFDAKGSGQLVARLDASTGTTLGVRASSGGAAWLDDAGEAVLGIVKRSRKSATSWKDGAVIVGDLEITIVRPADDGAVTQRLAAPPLKEARVTMDRVVGRADVQRTSELVVIPLPERAPADTSYDLELEPRGVVQASHDETATVAFVGATMGFMNVQHPKHGIVRLKLVPGEQPPAKGDEVILEGVTVKPGPVVSVARWRRSDAAPTRTVASFSLPAEAKPRSGADGVSAAPDVVAPFVARAAAATVTVPAEVLSICSAVETDPVLRAALADIGMHFGERDLDLDAVDRLVSDDQALAAFVPLWHDGNGGDVGGVIHGKGAAKLALLDLSGGKVRDLGETFAGAMQAIAARGEERKATVAYLESRLATLTV